MNSETLPKDATAAVPKATCSLLKGGWLQSHHQYLSLQYMLFTPGMSCAKVGLSGKSRSKPVGRGAIRAVSGLKKSQNFQ